MYREAAPALTTGHGKSGGDCRTKGRFYETLCQGFCTNGDLWEKVLFLELTGYMHFLLYICILNINIFQQTSYNIMNKLSPSKSHPGQKGYD
jgi:hypothetical protein